MKYFIIVSAMLCSVVLSGGESFSGNISAFAASQRIADFMIRGKRVLDSGIPTEEHPRGKLSWSSYLQDFINKSRSSSINSFRMDMMSRMIDNLNLCGKEKFADFDEAVNKIMDIDLSDRKDFIFAIAVCVRLERFMEVHRDMFAGENAREVRRKAYYNIEEAQKKLLEAVRTRYEDNDLKMLAEDFQKLFPRKRLLLHHSPPADFNHCRDLFNSAMTSFWLLDQYSALAEFEDWGQCMLDYMVLDGNPVFEAEFKRQMQNYQNSFRR